MNTMKWLLKREYWEHKGGFFWTPAVIGTIMSVILAVSLIAAVSFGSKHGMQINGTQVSNLSQAMDATEKKQFLTALTNGYMGTGAPLFLVMGFVVFFYSLGSLYDERKDRSVLFWISLPVSDSETVLSKVAMALVAAPLLTLGFATVTSLLSLLFICIAAAASGLNVFGAVLASPAIYLSPFEVAAIIPVYVLWALPTVGWLMMVSAWAKTKPFLWAVGLPLLIGALLAWFNALFDFGWNVSWYWQHIFGRGLLSVAPGSWFGMIHNAADLKVDPEHADAFLLLTQSWRILATANLWIGVVVGSAMIFVATRLRRWKDEG
jgi:ABC-2 type transport system permease protein